MRILIADDHSLLREALQITVSSLFPDAEVLPVSDFPSAWRAAEAGVDLIISDLMMPGASADEGIGKLMQACPTARFIVLTGQEDERTLLTILDLGVHGFITKTTEAPVIEAAIRLVLAGGIYLPPELRNMNLQERPSAPRGAADTGLGRLSARQLEVLSLMVRGAANKEIALQLNISPATVKSHIAHIIGCFGAANRTEAAMKARELGII